MIEQYTISVDECQIEDLHQRLDNTRLFMPVKDADWQEGVPTGDLSDLLAYWRNGFDWRAQERKLNNLPHFMCTLDCGQQIHFIYKKGRGTSRRPLLISHGWPGSFVEMTDIISLLAEPLAHGADPLDAFDVIVPSLPGYGFSPAPESSGTDLYEIAGMFAELMNKLGYRSFFAQGGDWGAHVTSWPGCLDI